MIWNIPIDVPDCVTFLVGVGVSWNSSLYCCSRKDLAALNFLSISESVAFLLLLGYKKNTSSIFHFSSSQMSSLSSFNQGSWKDRGAARHWRISLDMGDKAPSKTILFVCNRVVGDRPDPFLFHQWEQCWPSPASWFSLVRERDVILASPAVFQMFPIKRKGETSTVRAFAVKKTKKNTTKTLWDL